MRFVVARVARVAVVVVARVACVARVVVQAALVACRAACFSIPNACLCFPSVRFGFVFCVCLLAIFFCAFFLSATVCTRWHELVSCHWQSKCSYHPESE